MKIYIPINAGPYSCADTIEWIADGPLFTARATIGASITQGHLEPLPARILEVDPEAGTSNDITREIAMSVGQATILDESEPFSDLRDWLTARGVDFYREPDGDDFDPRREWGTLCRQMQL